MVRKLHLGVGGKPIHRALLVCVSLFVSCDRTPAPPPMEEPVERSIAARDVGAEIPAPVVYRGEPVAVTPVEVLHKSTDLRVEKQAWKFESVEGLAWRVRVPLDAAVDVVASDDVAPFASLLPADEDGWAAINGGFYEVDGDGYRPMGLVIEDGNLRSELTRRGGSGVFVVDEDGPRVVHRRHFEGDPSMALQSVDRIVAGGASVVSRKPDATGAARSAVVVGREHLWLVIAVAKRDVLRTERGIALRRTRTGLPLWAFAEYLIDTTEVRDALNLDGGISTQLAVRDGDYELFIEGVSGTINALVVRVPSQRTEGRSPP